MSFRRRITIVSAAAVAIAVLLASVLIYVLTSDQLHSQVDGQLRNRGRGAAVLLHLLAEPSSKSAAQLELRARTLGLGLRSGAQNGQGAGGDVFGKLPPNPGQVRGYQQVDGARGMVIVRSAPGITLPVGARTRALAERGGRPYFEDARVKGIHLRILAEPFGAGRAVQFAQPLTDVDGLLSRLRLILALVCAGGIALAALLGRLVAGAAVQPLKRLAQAAEHVAETRDLSRRIEPAGEDEIGRLARNFNAMLDALARSIAALDASVDAQRQLVADASHELRTPLTSVRTNVEILQQQGSSMDPAEQSRLLCEVVEQIEDLTLLVNDLIDLARGEDPHTEAEDVRLDALIEEVLERFRRHSPATPLHAELEPALVTAVPARLERAVSNLLDNALKYSPPGEPVEVSLHGGELQVRDRGPGIDAQDLPHIFDRFYRGADARRRPGSGLGLAIVRQVAEQQGGSVSAESAAGGER